MSSLPRAETGEGPDTTSPESTGEPGKARKMLLWFEHSLLQWFGLLLGIAALAWAVHDMWLSPSPVTAPRPGPAQSVTPAAAPDAGEALALATAPQQFQPVTAEEAVAENIKLPFSKDAVEIARPFILSRLDQQQFAYARTCLAAAIYYEARNEPLRGREAVAQVVLNRLRHPAFPKSVCGVVFQGSERATGCQFTFTCDGAMQRPPAEPGWSAANAAAEAALTGRVEPTVGWSTHYHTQWVVPLWAPTLRKTALIGAHYFYRMPRTLSGPRAFVDAGWAPELPAAAILRLLPAAALPLPIDLPKQQPLPVQEDAPLARTGAIDMKIPEAPPQSPGAPSASPSETKATPAAKAPEIPARRRGTLPM